MDKEKRETGTVPQKKLILIFFLLSILYFGILLFPNATGAKTVEMIAVFEIDEYAQYPHALQLLDPGATPKQSLRNFLVYDHYFYGYPFYFFSGLSLIPLRWIAGTDWHSQPQTILLVLRQLVNVLPNILSVWLLTYAATRFKPALKSISLFVVLLFSSGLLNNGLWWHPDGIGLLFVALAMCLLRIDRLRFGLFFYLTAVSVGVAFGVKYMGAFFVLLIPTYLIIGIVNQRIRWPKAILLAAAFVGIMLMTVVISNPLLLLQERSAVIDNQILQFSQTSQGILSGKQPFLQNGWLPQWFTSSYGSLPFLLLLAAGLVLGIIRKEKRIQYILLAAWVLPYTIFVLNASSQRPHYWLPILLPLMTVLPIFFPDNLFQPMKWQKKVWLSAAALLIVGQLFLFVQTDIHAITQTLQREENSPSLQFYNTVRLQWIAAPASNDDNLIYRDWHIYYPSGAGLQVFMDWELADYELIQDRQPDYLMLERANVVTYGAEAYLSTAPDPVGLQAMHVFYRDALLNQIDGYRLVYQDSFGMLFSKNAD